MKKQGRCQGFWQGFSGKNHGIQKKMAREGRVKHTAFPALTRF
jgi:hypothetical protein